MIAATSWFLITLCGLGLPIAALAGGADARRDWRAGGVICGVSGAFYICGLVIVDLGTPKDFVRHVETSLDRVLLTPTLLFLCGLSAMVRDGVKALWYLLMLRF